MDRHATWSRRLALTTSLLFTLLASGPAAAQEPAPACAGKTVNLIIGFGPGGGYDAWGRLVADFIGAHLPGNPAVVAQNMPGGGSFRAASFMYNQAPKDGTTIAPHRARCGARPAYRPSGRAVRPDQIVVYRHPRNRNQRVHRQPLRRGAKRAGP